MVAKSLGIGLLLTGTLASAQSPTVRKVWPPFAPSHVEQPMMAANSAGASGATESVYAPTQQIPVIVVAPALPKSRVAMAAPVRQVKTQDPQYNQDADSEMYTVQLEVPTIERVTRRESERNLQERIKQEARNRPDIGRVEFPYEAPVSTEAYVARQFPPMTVCVEPNYLCYGRLYFEDRNSERFGWDLGPIQTLVSASIFFWDVATLPYQLGTDPCRRHDCNTGYCLPGDPVPYYLYPPQLSLTGVIFQGGAVVALVGAFPA
jgi:hypothetical protein